MSGKKRLSCFEGLSLARYNLSLQFETNENFNFQTLTSVAKARFCDSPRAGRLIRRQRFDR